MSDPILDFEAYRDLSYADSTMTPEMRERAVEIMAEGDAKKYAERRVAEAVAPYQALVAAVREWRNAVECARSAQSDEDATPESLSSLFSWVDKAEDALAALPLPEVTP